uniref:Uncharacterized protein n=1 Tax=Craspedostauros australis TaxID=1486917 RepID=A0A7R9WM48_9STRA
MSFGSSGGNNPVVSRTSSTRIVNGQRTTEVTLRRADGTVERHVESTNPPSTNVQRLAHSAPQQAQRRQQQRMQQQQQQQQQRPSTRSGRRKNDGAAAAVGIHGEEQENEDDDAATDFDVCLGNNDHPGTIALIQAVDRALQKYPDDADDANRYRYVRDKMMGRRYFLTLPDNTFLLTADQIQDMIIQILHDRTNRIPRQSSSGSRRDTGGSVPTTSEARRPNANDMNVKPRGVARGSSIDKMQEKYKPPSKRQK